MFLTVYKIENESNGKIYIGCSKDTEKRYKGHAQALQCGFHPCEEMQEDYFHGDLFSFSELCKIEFDKSAAYHASQAMHGVEAYYTIKYNSDLNGYNKKHVATWRTRADARPVKPDTENIKQSIKEDINLWKEINTRTRERGNERPVNHQLRFFRMVEPSDKIKLFFGAPQEDIDFIKAHGLNPEDVFRYALTNIDKLTA